LRNLALCQQLAVFRRTVKRPPIGHRDRGFRRFSWRNWRTALIVVHADTLLRCLGLPPRLAGESANGLPHESTAVFENLQSPRLGLRTEQLNKPLLCSVG
jgi:hypothetical protein